MELKNARIEDAVKKTWASKKEMIYVIGLCQSFARMVTMRNMTDSKKEKKMKLLRHDTPS